MLKMTLSYTDDDETLSPWKFYVNDLVEMKMVQMDTNMVMAVSPASPKSISNFIYWETGVDGKRQI